MSKSHQYVVVGGFYIQGNSCPVSDLTTLKVFEQSLDAMNYAAGLKESYDWSKSMLVPFVT